MPNEPSSYRLTFNKPADKLFFNPEDAALRVRIEDGQLAFKAVQTTRGHKDAVAINPRPRGGREVLIDMDGERADELLDLLKGFGASHSHPFFVLTKARPVNAKDRGAAGWFQIETHFTEEGAPPKFAPHMRLWMPHDDVRAPRVPQINDEVAQMLGDVAGRIRAAKTLVDAFKTARHIGRPPTDVSEAMKLLSAFDALVREVLPDRNPATYLDMVVNAHSALGDFIDVMSRGGSGLDLGLGVSGDNAPERGDIPTGSTPSAAESTVEETAESKPAKAPRPRQPAQVPPAKAPLRRRRAQEASAEESSPASTVDEPVGVVDDDAQLHPDYDAAPEAADPGFVEHDMDAPANRTGPRHGWNTTGPKGAGRRAAA